MHQWAYLWISFDISRINVSVHCNQIGIEQLSLIFPKGPKKVEKIGTLLNITVNDLTEAILVEEQILNYLGSQGWEAYAREGTKYYMKMQVS